LGIVHRRFGNGDCALTVGKSGIELARMTIETASGEIKTINLQYTADRSPEHWAGWALAYYQWFSGLSFREILEAISAKEVIALYSPYHEMDVRQFCDRMTELCRKRKPATNLKYLRKTLGITQKELAEQSGIPLRTLQQHEQRQKDIILNCSRAVLHSVRTCLRALLKQSQLYTFLLVFTRN